MRNALIAAIVAAVVSAGAATATTTALITGAQIKNGSIGLADLSANAKRGLRGTRGTRGPTGPPGPAGLQGIAGGFDPAKLTLISGSSYSVAPDADVTADVYCPPTHPTPIFAGVGSYTGQISALIIYPNLGLARIRVSNFAYTFTITFTPYIVCSAR